jgi:branched-chain amino acid transport system substrate-binding protein
MYKRIIVFTIICTLLIGLLAGCGGGAQQASEDEGEQQAEPQEEVKDIKIKVGIVEPLTGSMAPLGTAECDAIIMAIEMINEKGGIDGKYPIEYVVADSQSDPGIGASEAERLITAEKVPILLGSYSSAIAMAISEVAERNKVVLWEMSGTTDDLLIRGYKWTFRTESQASSWGAASVECLVSELEKQGKEYKSLKVAIVHEDGPYGTAVAKGNEAWANKYGLNVVMKEAYSSKTVDLSNLIMKLKSANPDVLLLTSYVTDAILFNRQSKELGFTVPILITHSGGHSVQAFVDGVGDDANFLMTVDPTPLNPNLDAFDPELAELYEEFVSRWTDEYGWPPYHHVEHRQFAQSLILFNEIMPKVIERATDGEITPELIASVVRETKLEDGQTLMGHGVEFSTPDNTFKDPWLGNEHIGQNIKAHAFINQYFDKQLYCVWPEKYASREPVLFLPQEHPLAPKN